MRVQARSGRGAAEWDLAESREDVPDARDALSDLRSLPGELLAEGHGHGVHQVRAARLDDAVELLCLALERMGELLERRKEVVDHPVERREVHRGGEHVVRRLA